MNKSNLINVTCFVVGIFFHNIIISPFFTPKESEYIKDEITQGPTAVQQSYTSSTNNDLRSVQNKHEQESTNSRDLKELLLNEVSELELYLAVEQLSENKIILEERTAELIDIRLLSIDVGEIDKIYEVLSLTDKLEHYNMPHAVASHIIDSVIENLSAPVELKANMLSRLEAGISDLESYKIDALFEQSLYMDNSHTFKWEVIAIASEHKDEEWQQDFFSQLKEQPNISPLMIEAANVFLRDGPRSNIRNNYTLQNRFKSITRVNQK